MKKIIFMVSLVGSLFFGTNGAEASNFDKLEKSFHHAFHHAKNVHVFKKSNGITEFDFLNKGQYVAAFFDDSGTLIEADYNEDFKELPQSIKNLIHKEYSTSTIVEVIKVVYSQSYFYKIRLEAGGLSYSMAVTPEGEVTIGF